MNPADLFTVGIVRAANEAAAVYGYEGPTDTFLAEMLARIPPDTRTEIGLGMAKGIVGTGRPGHSFTIAGLAANKGPYRWFSANRGPGVPSPNWEYFFQVAEFVRLVRHLPPKYTVGFEDGLMDVSVRDAARLIWYVEVKAKATMLGKLLALLRDHGAKVDLTGPDRGKDALRKAKYLVRHRPPLFSLVGGEERLHFRVEYPTDDGFRLVELGDPLSELAVSANLVADNPDGQSRREMIELGLLSIVDAMPAQGEQ